MSDEMERRAREFVAKLMKDAEPPHTGNFKTDAEAWPGSGIEAEEIVRRVCEFAEKERLTTLEEAAKVAETHIGGINWATTRKLVAAAIRALAGGKGVNRFYSQQFLLRQEQCGVPAQKRTGWA